MRYKSFQVGQLFDLVPGQFHATSELEIGPVPLVSCGWENNGVIGFYDIPAESTHLRALSVAFNGAPLTTHFHPYLFGAKDDVAVLIPINAMVDSLLIYVAALLNGKTWRYSYGRKCYRDKLRYVPLALPVVEDTDELDATLPDTFLKEAHERVRAAALKSVEALVIAS